MASYTWAAGVSGAWNNPANWGSLTAPNEATADVTIDALAPPGGLYTVQIAAGETITVNSLSVNGTVNRAGSNTDPYNAAKLEVDGTLIFAPGSAGLLDGPFQTFISMTNGTMVNVGTINGFIQGTGNVLFTGTNGFFVTNWLQALGGVVTIDTPIAELQGTVLFDGIFEAKGANSAVMLGGPLTNTIVNIGTIIGPPAFPEGWTEIIWNDASASIMQWNGTSYVSLETTLKEIGNRGTVDVLEGRGYTSPNTLTVLSGGMLNLAAGTVSTAGININGGIVQGNARITSDAVNDGTMTAIGGTLAVTGTLSGNGVVNFDLDNKPTGTLAAGGSTVELNAVTAGQTIIMDGNDRLLLNTPSAFLGSIQATVGDQLVLAGITPTSASVSGSDLIITGASGTLATLKLVGDYSAENFVVNGSTLTVASGAPTPTPTPTPLPTPVPTPPPTPTPTPVPTPSPTPSPVDNGQMSGPISNYLVYQSGSGLVVQDTTGQDGLHVYNSTVTFTNGTVIQDPTGNAGMIHRLYEATLGREADLQGLQAWTAQADDTQVPLASIAMNFVQSPEFIQANGSNSSSADLVTAMYRNMFGREPDAAGLQGWVNALDQGMSRGQLALSIANSPEGLQNAPNSGDPSTAFVYRMYETALDRAPDAAGLAGWSAQMQNGVSKTAIANNFVNSAEFQLDYGALSDQDFVSALYTNVLGRAADASGLAAWSQAAASAGRASVVQGFADSDEMRYKMATTPAAVQGGGSHDGWVFIPS